MMTVWGWYCVWIYAVTRLISTQVIIFILCNSSNSFVITMMFVLFSKVLHYQQKKWMKKHTFSLDYPSESVSQCAWAYLDIFLVFFCPYGEDGMRM